MNQKNNQKEEIRIIKSLLVEQLGLDIEDVDGEDGFTDDLHMNPTDIADFLQRLQENGFEIEPDDFEDIKTFRDLTDFLVG